MNTMNTKLGQLFQDTNVGAQVRRTFDLMEIAEGAIKRAGKSKKLANIFLLLMPTDTSRLSDAIYRQHCTEIINRALGGLDTRPGTDAECLAALSSASLKSPLKHAYVVAMEKLFSRVFPGTDLGQRLTDDAPTETDEIIADLRRELLVPSRKA